MRIWACGIRETLKSKNQNVRAHLVLLKWACGAHHNCLYMSRLDAGPAIPLSRSSNLR